MVRPLEDIRSSRDKVNHRKADKSCHTNRDILFHTWPLILFREPDLFTESSDFVASIRIVTAPDSNPLLMRSGTYVAFVNCTSVTVCHASFLASGR